MFMGFVGLFLCIVAIYLLYLKMKFKFTGTVVEGEIVGYDYGARGTYGFRGYNYRIRLKYQNEIYIVSSIESVVTIGNTPTKNIGQLCKVYFNPQSPKRVSIKGKNGIIWIAFITLFSGLLAVLASIY